ncbi:MAG: hypothetical protein AB7O26_21035 [Planctomycetaceae bacterium]
MRRFVLSMAIVFTAVCVCRIGLAADDAAKPAEKAIVPAEV